MRLTPERFEQLAESALEGLPARFKAALGNLEICVQALPGKEAGREKGSSRLLGLYISGEPARILLYQRNIERGCETETEVEEELGITLRHEIGHHFGMGEAGLRRAGH